MNLAEQLANHKTAIVNKWFNGVVATYPAETARFLQSQKDAFTNPVGRTTLNSLHALYDLLGSQADLAAVQKVQEALDPVIRIRAVQSFSPSQAVGFIFALKKIIHETLPASAFNASERMSLDHRIDQLGLVAFDIFMACREKIFDLKAGELKDRTYKALARAGLVDDLA